MTIEDLIVGMADIKPLYLKKLFEEVDAAAKIWEMTPEYLRSFGLTVAKVNKLFSVELRERAIAECEFIYKNGIRVITIHDSDYPENLLECEDSPYLLYVRGDINFNENSNKYISFIGTRNSTPYGEGICTRLIEQIAKSHPFAVIVSGLAYGIDTIAHRAALNNGLKTIAVVPCGLKNIQPASNYNLAQQIVESGGAVVSEFSSETPLFKHLFAARNRIVAGISMSTVVIESPLKSGTMITANFASGYGREVFAVPGRAIDASFQGCNSLIKSSKAQLIENLSDIEFYLGWDRQPTLFDTFAPDLSGIEQKVYDCFDSNSEISEDEIISRLDISVSTFFQAVTMLEVMGLIKSVRGKLFIKI